LFSVEHGTKKYNRKMKEKLKVRVIARTQIFMVESTVRKKREREREREKEKESSLVAVIAESSLT